MNLGIVVGQNATVLEQHAARELAEYAKLITDKVVRVRSESGDPRGRGGMIVLGTSESSRLVEQCMQRPERSLENLGGEGFFVESVEHEGGQALVIGSARPVGVLYGVYAYLEKACGVGFFLDGERVPKMTSLPLAGIDFVEKPAFQIRASSAWTAHRGLKKLFPRMWGLAEWKDYLDWCAKKRFNMVLGFDLCWYSGMYGDLLPLAFPEDYSYPPKGPAKEDEGSFALRGFGDEWDSAWDWPLRFRRELTQKILAYARSLGILVPYTLGYGDVLAEYKRKHPELKYVGDSANNPNLGFFHDILHPSQEACTEYVEQSWRKLIELFGTDHIYRVSPYSEQTALGEDHLAIKRKATEQLLKVMTRVDEKARWMADAWDMVVTNWPAADVKSYLSSVEKSHYFPIVSLDMEVTRRYDCFWGFEWIYDLLGYFAGWDWLCNDMWFLTEEVQQIANSEGHKGCVGIHQGSEFVYDPLFTELYAALGWNPDGLTVEGYLRDHVIRRYGNASAERMFQVYVAVARYMKETRGLPDGSDILNGDPRHRKIALKSTRHDLTHPFGVSAQSRVAFADQALPVLRQALVTALHESEHQKGNELYEKFIVDLAIELVGQECFREMIKMAQAYRKGIEDASERRDSAISRMKSYRDAAVRSYQHIIAILETRPEFSLRVSVDDMHRVPGTNPYTETAIKRTAQNLYMRNSSLELYRQVCLPEFKALAERMLDRLTAGEKEPLSPDDPELMARLVQISQDFLNAPMPTYVRPAYSAVEAVRSILAAFDVQPVVAALPAYG